jgi:hypothetical protein
MMHQHCNPLQMLKLPGSRPCLPVALDGEPSSPRLPGPTSWSDRVFFNAAKRMSDRLRYRCSGDA